MGKRGLLLGPVSEISLFLLSTVQEAILGNLNLQWHPVWLTGYYIAPELTVDFAALIQEACGLPKNDRPSENHGIIHMCHQSHAKLTMIKIYIPVLLIFKSQKCEQPRKRYCITLWGHNVPRRKEISMI